MDDLITASSLEPEPDPACVSTCYYVGWTWSHDHAPVAEELQA